jgi:hypothetical protein
MFTVLFFDDRSQAEAEKFSILFAPYVSEKKIAIAKWNTEGIGFADSFPDLFSILKGVEKWRAAFVVEPEDLKCKNVYDRPSHAGKNIYDPFEYEKDYIIRASQILGGLRRKVKTLVEKKPEDKDGYLPPPEIVTAPVNPPRDLVDLYYLPVTSPLEILYFSKRMEHGEKEDIEELQSKLYDNENRISSLFYERNNYPKICRFIVFDIVDKSHIRYPFMLLKFFVCVLSCTLNDIEPNLLQAYRLYTVDCEIGRGAMKSFLGVLGSRVSSLIKSLKDYDQYASMPPLDDFDDIGEPERIPLVYENAKYDNLIARTNFVGLVKDVPTVDEPEWQRQVSGIMHDFHYFLKVPDRALSLAAGQTRRKSKLDVRELKALDRFQLEDFEEVVEKTGKQVFSMDTVTLLDKKHYYAILEEKDQKVKQEMRKRMTQKHASRGFLVAALLYLLGMVPLLIASFQSDAGHAFAAVGISAFACVLIGLGGYIMLRVDKNRLRSLIDGYNATMHRIIREISDAMDMFSDYLTLVCAFIKGQATIEELRRIRDSHNFRDSAISSRLLFAYQMKSRIEGIAKCMDIDLVQSGNSQYYDDMDLLMFGNDVAAQLLSPVVPENEKIRLNNTLGYTADRINAPYWFVTRMYLYYQELFEDIPKELFEDTVIEQAEDAEQSGGASEEQAEGTSKGQTE